MRTPRGELSGVSPVIAVVLLVAITIVLSAVVYVMVSNLTVRIGGSDRLAAAVEQSRDGTNWTVRIVASQGSFPANLTYIVVRGLGGETLLPRTALGTMPDFWDTTDPGFVSPGDTLNLSTAVYPAGAVFQLMDDETVLFQGTLR